MKPLATTRLAEDCTGYAGQFRSGRLTGTRPESLACWRVTTVDAGTAQTVAQLLGGQPEASQEARPNHFEVMTDQPTVHIVVDGADAITTDMKLWGREGIVHHCSGGVFLSPRATKGRPCGCPILMSEHLASAKSGDLPQPDTTLTFRLAHSYDLGLFHFQSPSGHLAKSTGHIRNGLSAAKGESLCELAIELVKFTARDGSPMSYRKPVIRLIRPWNEMMGKTPY